MNLFGTGLNSEWIILLVLFLVIFSGKHDECCKPSECGC